MIIESRLGPKTGGTDFRNFVGTVSQELDEGGICATMFKRICREIGANSDSKIGRWLNGAGGETVREKTGPQNH